LLCQITACTSAQLNMRLDNHNDDQALPRTRCVEAPVSHCNYSYL
jgi:hypothetical protein